MKISAPQLLRGLLQRNYFPLATPEYIPPVFTTEGFTPEVASLMRNPTKKTRGGELSGFDHVSYIQTRFNLVPREFAIPHPRAYAPLCFCICDNWADIAHIAESTSSVIKPRNHEDGRIVVMSYDDKEDKEYWLLDKPFAARFVADTDISKFYPSVYTHAIGWAAVGISEAKKAKNDKGEWFNELDLCQRMTARNETKGIPIGPATSLIISEFILQSVDSSLQKQFPGYLRRAIDDYKYHAPSREEAEKFISVLSAELMKFKLHLNSQKTRVLELPDPSDDAWLFDIRMALNAVDVDYPVSMKRFMDHMVVLAKKRPGKSVLKYAAKCLIGEAKSKRTRDKSFTYKHLVAILLDYAYHYPAIVPLLSDLFKFFRARDENIWEISKAKVEKILCKGVARQWSDVAAWTLYFFYLFGDCPDIKIARKIVRTKDCLPLVLLCLVGHKDTVVAFAKNFVKGQNGGSPDCHELDGQWLLLYQLFLEGEISNPYPDEDSYGKDCFNILKKHHVSFLSKDVQMAKNTESAPSAPVG